MAGREQHGFGRAVAGRLRVAAAPILAVMLAGLVAACAAAPGSASAPHRTASVVAAEQAAGTTITETGSTLLYPLASTWAKAYHQQQPGVTVTTAGTGSGKGIEDASDGTADIGASDAYLSSGDLVKNSNLLNIPLAVSAQTVIYNVTGLPPGSHLELDGTVLAGIYSGTITRWDDPAIKALNKALPLPSLAIVPVHRSDSSGDTFLFTSYLSTQDPKWDASIGYGTTATWPSVAGALAKKGSLSVLQACATTPGCVAYNGISYQTQAQTDGLGEAALQNSAGKFTLPTPTAITDSVDSFVSAHTAQRDDLDDRRPVGRREGIPDRQLRVRRRRRQAARRRPGGRDQGLPDLGDHHRQRPRVPGYGGVPAAVRLAGDAGRGADRGDRLVTATLQPPPPPARDPPPRARP